MLQSLYSCAHSWDNITPPAGSCACAACTNCNPACRQSSAFTRYLTGACPTTPMTALPLPPCEAYAASPLSPLACPPASCACLCAASLRSTACCCSSKSRCASMICFCELNSVCVEQHGMKSSTTAKNMVSTHVETRMHLPPCPGAASCFALVGIANHTLPSTLVLGVCMLRERLVLVDTCAVSVTPYAVDARLHSACFLMTSLAFPSSGL